MLKQPCNVNVTWTTANAEGRQYANVAGVTKPMKGQTFGKPGRPFVLAEEVDADTIEQVKEHDHWLWRIFGKPVSERMAESNEGGGKAAKSQTNGHSGTSKQEAPQEEFTQF
jgi:hypothetical protein